MKWFLFFTMFFCSVGQAQNIYFSEPTSTHVDYIGTGGSGPIAYNMYAANGWVIYHYWARLTFPDGSQTDWMYGETGGWWVTKAGTYQIEGKASGESIFGGGVVMLYRWPFSFNVVDNYSPSAPQNLQVSKSSNNHPQLTWTLNSELDMSHYIIYKKITEEWGW